MFGITWLVYTQSHLTKPVNFYEGTKERDKNKRGEKRKGTDIDFDFGMAEFNENKFNDHTCLIFRYSLF